MTGVDRGVAPRPRWADLVDTDGDAGDDPTTLSLEELIEEADAICVSVRMEGGGSAYVAMQPRDTVSDLNLWIEKTQGLRRNSFALSHNGHSPPANGDPRARLRAAPDQSGRGRVASGDAPSALQFSR